ncbi:hypothetical protein [Klebsiella pneumoniae]|uniref:hypothetical protein n=1 Tax=Klebsiella pneumoniae TaxID=573 RepID=UPI0030D1AD1C
MIDSRLINCTINANDRMVFISAMGQTTTFSGCRNEWNRGDNWIVPVGENHYFGELVDRNGSGGVWRWANRWGCILNGVNVSAQWGSARGKYYSANFLLLEVKLILSAMS